VIIFCIVLLIIYFGDPQLPKYVVVSTINRIQKQLGFDYLPLPKRLLLYTVLADWFL